MYIEKFYDVIIIGGGHAGTEASIASSQMGMKTLLITQNLDNLGQMSCNPSIGGIGKSQLVKEIDALDGIMALSADYSGIHFRVLNSSKGSAVHSTRAQIDRVLYKIFIRHKLQKQKNLDMIQQSVYDLIVKQNKIQGVITTMGLKIQSNAVILTTGTFLMCKIHVGNIQYNLENNEHSNLSGRLKELNISHGRLKTGTPPRIDGRTIDYKKMLVHTGDIPTPVFSYLGNTNFHPKQVCCYITKTTPLTHEIIKENLYKSPVYSGVIKGIGPRYCPSIEDKINRFSEKLSHQIFVEPEGLRTNEIYPNGISTSLPLDIQIKFVKTIIGFEHAHITRPGYAVEYDYFNPIQLTPFLQSKFIENLFFAGQINGTTGYEEAASQGIIAGINAALLIKERNLWCPRRDEAYIGVLIDDLINNGTKEPYRMFTSRSEYRLLLREDNADLRLTEIGYKLGVVSKKRWNKFKRKKNIIDITMKKLKSTSISYKENKEILHTIKNSKQNNYLAIDLLKYKDINYDLIRKIDCITFKKLEKSIEKYIENQIKYSGYINRQLIEIERLKKYTKINIPTNINYFSIPSISDNDAKILNAIQPKTLYQVINISTIKKVTIELLLIYLKKQHLLL